MALNFDSHYQLLQSLRAAFPDQGQARLDTEQLEDLAQARQQLRNLIAGSQISEQQQQALEMLRRRTSVDAIYGNRIKRLEESDDADSVRQRDEIARLYQHALQRVRQDWPELGKQENESLSRLVLLQQVEESIQQHFNRMTGKKSAYR